MNVEEFLLKKVRDTEAIANAFEAVLRGLIEGAMDYDSAVRNYELIQEYRDECSKAG